MKRIIALILMLAMTVTLLASCNLIGGGNNGGGTTADFVMPEGGYDGSAVTIRFYHSMGAGLQTILNDAIADAEGLCTFRKFGKNGRNI